jgi:uncharacterized protein (TIGR01777 family)
MMRTPREFTLSSTLPVSADRAYAWHARPGALERLIPPWEPVEVVARTGGIEDGGRVTLRVGSPPLALRWEARHGDFIRNRSFVDEQVEGPFARWTHTHLFEPLGSDTCRLTDRVEYELPLEPFSTIGAGLVEDRLARVFAYRHATTREDLAAHARFADSAPFHIAITGATGLIGSALLPFLTTGGHRVTRVVRGSAAPGDVVWDPARGRLDARALEGVDAVVHLAGENIAGRRWNAARKRALLESRLAGTRLLAETLAGMARPPRVLIAVSAIGYYGDRADEPLDETTHRGSGGAPGADFLAELCEAWESAAEPARAAGIRVVHPRLGLVLTPRGGALAKMIVPFRLGLGGPMGDGRQWMSWVSIDDVIGAIHHALLTPAVVGPANVVAPESARNAEFARVLGRVLHRPAIFPVPKLALDLAVGELADALLASARVVPGVLERTGYRFRHRSLEAALRHVLGKGEIAVDPAGL